jgi:hypothetical protein
MAWCWSSSGWPSRKDEQLRRFKERECVAFKRFKITAEDWRNREQVGPTSRGVRHGRPHVDRGRAVDAGGGQQQVYARVKVLKTLCRAVESALQSGGGAPAPGSRRKGRDR